MQLRLCNPILVLTAYFLLPTALCAQDFGLELMKSRASLDGVIMDAGPKYHEIKAQADSISDAIEKLREELNCHSERSPKPYGSGRSEESRSDSRWEVSFRRKVICIGISIKALEAEVRSLFTRGTMI